MKRRPAVAGQFYNDGAERLSAQVRQFLDVSSGKTEAAGIVVPHAGLIYSGAVAGAVYSSIDFPRTFLMLGPNHTGLGADISLVDEGEWDVPTGTVKVDRKLAGRLLREGSAVRKDVQAHMFEHSLEVQLPFITCISKEVKIVPVVIRSATFTECDKLGQIIADAIKDLDYSVTVLASSDMSHYVSDRTARSKDRLAIDKILAIDPEGLYETVVSQRISMCGYLPVTIMLSAVKYLGAEKSLLIKYATSGEVSGDYDNVVGYAGLVVTR